MTKSKSGWVIFVKLFIKNFKPYDFQKLIFYPTEINLKSARERRRYTSTETIFNAEAYFEVLLINQTTKKEKSRIQHISRQFFPPVPRFTIPEEKSISNSMRHIINGSAGVKKKKSCKSRSTLVDVKEKCNYFTQGTYWASGE